MATENLQIPDIAASQNQKEVTANAAHNLLDRAINKNVQKTITGDTSLTVTEARENILVELTGTPGAAFTVNMPDTNKRTLAILNNTGQQATIRNSAAGGADQPVIADGDQSFFHYDGVDFTALGGGGAATFLELTDTPASYSGQADKAAHVNVGATALEFRVAPYDIATNFAGAPAASEIIMRFLAARNYRLPSGLTNSQGLAGTAATAETIFDIQKNGASVGSMTFAISATVPTFSMASDTDFAAGDRVDIVAPATPDSTLANIAVTLAGLKLA